MDISKREEVFCQDCRYLYKKPYMSIHTGCWYYTWYCQHKRYMNYLVECKDLNDKCNCLDFKRKWWKFWID